VARWGEVVTAMVTPFGPDLSLDVDAAVALGRWLADNGSTGIVLAGTTGESATLGDDEKLELWRAVAEAVTIPVIAGTGTNDTRHSAALTERATACGVDAVLVVTPYYNRPSQAGLDAHFRAVAAATTLPVIAYDIPIRTGRKISHDVLVGLAREVPNFLAVKDAALDVGASARLLAAVPAGLELYSGNDDQTLPLLAVGAVGVVGVATHWAGQQFAEMIASFTKGDVATAREVNARLLESYDFETSEAAPNPLPAKAMMRALGHPVGECRPPMGPTPPGLEDRAREVLARLRG
jgi:4-hydroxy-tetrahydrodipicolinate synthase